LIAEIIVSIQIVGKATDLIKTGERGKAKRILIDLLRENPSDERAWILLSRCVTTRQQKIDCLRIVLEMNPKNQTARRALHNLQSKPKQQHSLKYFYLFGVLVIAVVLIFGVLSLAGFFQNVKAAPAVSEEYIYMPDTSLQIQPINLPAVGIDESLSFDSVDSIEIGPEEIESAPLPDTPEGFCVPKDTQRDIVKVLQVLTADRILVDRNGEQIIVSYIGLDASTLKDHIYSQSLATNRSLEGQQVTLVQDVTDSTPDGIHPRYVFVGGTFVNYQLLYWGLGITVNNPPDNSCFGFFLVAQTEAQGQRIGAWAPPLPEEWRAWPVVPEISDYSQLVYFTGLANGNDPKSFSVIGDCQSLPWRFLGRIDWDSYELPEGYAYLQPMVDWFSGDFSRAFVSVRNSATVATMFSPLWADPDRCKSTENPLECEFRLNNPSIVLISLGTNWQQRPPEEFEHYMREIVKFSLAHNVLPIIATKADATASDYPLNYAMARVAYDFDIPLWNFWAAVQFMPYQGMDPQDVKGIHILSSAYSFKRITAIQILHTVRTSIEGFSP
jgi:hypothetical protein